jgi:large subunit ribosomal protein L10e
MALRKASCYSKKYTVPFTRKSKFKKRAYIKAVPNVHLTKMRMGDLAGWKAGKYTTIMTVRTKHRVQLRDNALEASRQFLNRFLTDKVGKDYYLEVKPYPHHVMRENKMITGAGADRMQTGMALSFGKSIAKAALLKKNSPLFMVAVSTEKGLQATRSAMKEIKSKLPMKTRVEFTDLNKEKVKRAEIVANIKNSTVKKEVVKKEKVAKKIPSKK